MYDISNESSELRVSVARAVISVPEHFIELIRSGECPCGDPLTAARTAGVLAAKKTGEIIPAAPQVPLDSVALDFETGTGSIEITATIKAVCRAGTDTEAFMAASAAAAAIYDALKPLQAPVEVTGIGMVKGGMEKRSRSNKQSAELRAGVLMISDPVHEGRKQDTAGQTVRQRLEELGLTVAEYEILPDDEGKIKQWLRRYADDLHLDLVLTCGGTAFTSGDRTPEATTAVLDQSIPGISEAARWHGLQRTPHAMFSRGVAGLRGRTMIVNLPGSRKGAAESMDALFPGLLHAFRMIAGRKTGGSGNGGE